MDTVNYVELFWDCPECGHSHISSVFNPQGNRCPHCFYWRLEGIKLYEAPDSKIITDPNLINRKPFWVCRVCYAVNEDTGLPAYLLQCGNCDSYQDSAVGGMAGNQPTDQEAPKSVKVGEPVEFRSNSPTGISLPSVQPTTPNKNKHWQWLRNGLTILTLIGGGFLGSSLWLEQMNDPALLPVHVTDLQWTVEIDVQEKKTLTKQSWRDLMPTNALIVKSEKRQRGTRQEQRGSKLVTVQERYQSGTRTETYYESERYQSGTGTETYYESERYQSGTKEECKTTSMGNGIGRRICKNIPVYGTRKVPHTRSVPVYSTRQVPHTRSVPVYSARQVTVRKPIMVSVPIKDTWVTYQVSEWTLKQTYKRTGWDDASRNIRVKLAQRPPQRISATRIKCYIKGNFTIRKSWFELPESKSGSWNLPCPDYDRINMGDQITIRQNDTNSATLVRSAPNEN